jgi:hypothetical protein
MPISQPQVQLPNNNKNDFNLLGQMSELSLGGQQQTQQKQNPHVFPNPYPNFVNSMYPTTANLAMGGLQQVNQQSAQQSAQQSTQ